MDVEEFLASGAFVETQRGPHFCQIGKEYVLVFGGLGYLLTAKEMTTIKGKETVIFQTSPGDTKTPAGLVSDLEEIIDVADKGALK